jgi:hypothetical protein
VRAGWLNAPLATEIAVVTALLAGTVLCGCEFIDSLRFGRRTSSRGRHPLPDPVPVQQARAYPETATKKFLPLADFEDAVDGRRGYEEADFFSIRPAAGGSCRFVVNETRTGAGALEVTLPARRQLVFTLPDIHDFTGYSLLSVAVYSTAFRDDLQVVLTTRSVAWRSHRVLVKPGWNNVLFDIRRLDGLKSFEISDVRTIRLGFADAVGPVTFNIDDIMLIDNCRVIKPAPEGMTLRKDGLDYSLAVSNDRLRFVLAQDPEGIWRLGDHQATVQLAAPGARLAGKRPQIGLLGSRKVGEVSVLENNRVRVRLASTWFFPGRAGEWASLAVRRIEWQYTFYPDGRWVTHVELNNAGGREIGAVRILLPEDAAWAGSAVAEDLFVPDFVGPYARWSYLCAAKGWADRLVKRNYLRIGRLRLTLGSLGAGEGAAGKDGFDESQGCYFLNAKAGHCRFTIVPPPEGLLNPVFRVAGAWKGAVNVSSEGLAVRDVARLDDGSALFVLRGLIKRPTAVEVVGGPAPLAGT